MLREGKFVVIPALALLVCAAGRAMPQEAASPAHFANGGNAAQVPATFIDQRVFFPVRVNGGQPSLFELDTTAKASSLDPGRASNFGLKTEAETGAAGASGQIIRNATLGLPSVEIPLPSLSVNDSPDFARVVGQNFEGTLGADFLTRVIVQIDYAQQSVQVYDPASFHYQGKGVRIPFTLFGATPVIRAKFIEQSGKSGEGEFLVNTALNASVVFSNRFADAHKLFSGHMNSVTASDPEVDGGETVSLARLDTFQIGSDSVIGSVATFSRTDQSAGGDPKIAGTIGGGILRRFVVIFDYSHQQLILEPGAQFHNDDEEDKSGMALIAEGPGLKRFVVTQVQPDTPAAKAGIQKGDVVDGVDNEAAADMTLESVRTLFRQPVRTYDVLMERNGTTYEVNLQMRRRI
ncbi:MAG TPA: PDZ domain-containing protein [Candidatus Acidoferrales bacterium]|nr:PDZ domain-containing protein [Candidatus Acidoferrales bacterium]